MRRASGNRASFSICTAFHGANTRFVSISHPVRLNLHHQPEPLPLDQEDHAQPFDSYIPSMAKTAPKKQHSTTTTHHQPTRGGVKRPKKAPTTNLNDPGPPRSVHEPSPSLSSAPPASSPGPLHNAPGVYPAHFPLPSERKRDAEGHFLPVGPVEDESEDVVSETPEAWLARNGVKEMRFFSRTARSGRDPEFTKEWMKQFMALQVAKVKAIGGVAAASVRSSEDPLVLAARRVEEMSPAELVAASGFEFTSEEES